MDETFDQLRQALEQCSPVEGLTSLYMVTLPDGVRKLVNKMIRRGAATVSDLAGEFGLSEAETQQLVSLLEERGFVLSQKREADSAITYRVRLARTREFTPPPSTRIS
jgi:transcription initiation factor IIE alpha subunit